MPDRVAATDAVWGAVRAASPAAGPGHERGRLTFLGHSTVLIEVDDLRILTDPVLGRGFGPVRRQVTAVLPALFHDLDAVFISHAHHDHLDESSLRGIPGKPTVIVPRGFGSMATTWGLGPVEGGEAGDQLASGRGRGGGAGPPARVRPRARVRGPCRPFRAARPVRAERPRHRCRPPRIAD